MGPKVLLPFLLLATPSLLHGSLAGAEIDLRHLQNDTYEVDLVSWWNCDGATVPQTMQVEYVSPCGSGVLTVTAVGNEEVSMLCPTALSNSSCNGGFLPGYRRFVHQATIDLPPCDSWAVSFQRCCLDPVNSNLSAQHMTVTTTLNNLLMPCRDTPRYEQEDLPYTGSLGAFEHALLPWRDGPGFLSSSLGPLLDTTGTPYIYAPPFTGAEPYAGLLLDSALAQLSAPASGLAGGYVINVNGTLSDGLGNVLGTVQRMFLLVAIQEEAFAPALASGTIQLMSGQAQVTGPHELSLEPGQSFCFQAEFFDPDSADVITLGSDAATILPGATFTSTPGDTATASICWTAPPGTLGRLHFRIDARDDHCLLEGRQSFGYTVVVVPDTLDPCLNVGSEERHRTVTSVSVLPNPADGPFHMRFPFAASQLARLDATDLHGRQVPVSWTVGPDDAILVIPPSDRRGLVLIRWHTAGGTGVVRVLLR